MYNIFTNHCTLFFYYLPLHERLIEIIGLTIFECVVIFRSIKSTLSIDFLYMLQKAKGTYTHLSINKKYITELENVYIFVNIGISYP